MPKNREEVDIANKASRDSFVFNSPIGGLADKKKLYLLILAKFAEKVCYWFLQ